MKKEKLFDKKLYFCLIYSFTGFMLASTMNLKGMRLIPAFIIITSFETFIIMVYILLKKKFCKEEETKK